MNYSNDGQIGLSMFHGSTASDEEYSKNVLNFCCIQIYLVQRYEIYLYSRSINALLDGGTFKYTFYEATKNYTSDEE